MKLTWDNIKRKLSSRKFWVAIAGIASGIAIALGADASEIESAVGAVLMALSISSYIAGESYVDGKNKTVVEIASDEKAE